MYLKLSLLAFCVMSLAAVVHAQVPVRPTAPVKSPAPVRSAVPFKPAAPASIATASGGMITQAAKKMGVVKCANRVEQHERFFSQQNNPVSALSFVAPNDQNNRLFSLSLEIVEQNESVYVSTNYAPSGRDDCAASYDLVKYWPNSCKEVAEKVYYQFSGSGSLASQISVLGREPNVKVFLMPAGEGCVSIKKEIVF